MLILGESGSGKSTALRNFDPSEIGIFNVASKPLPFRKKMMVVNGAGYGTILKSLSNPKLKAYAIDDSQYLLAFEFFDHAREDDLAALRGKLLGVVLGEEEYIGNGGAKKTRLTVRQTRSVDAIRRGDFTVPALKPLKSSPASEPASFPSFGSFSPVEDDGDLPF